MAKRVLCYLRRVASSRVGYVLLILHLSLLAYDFAQKSPVTRAESNRVVKAGEMRDSAVLLAGRTFHYHYESSLLKFLIFVDLPGFFLSWLLSLVLLPVTYFVPLGAYDESWVAAGVFLLGASIQWQFIGFCLERVFKRDKSSGRAV